MEREHTRIMPKKTLVLPQPGQTLVLGEAPPNESGIIHYGAVLNGKYTINRTLSENTGEASLYVCTSDGREYVAKIYHHNKRPKKEILDRLATIDCPSLIPILEQGVIEERHFDILPYYQEGDLQKAAPLDPQYLINQLVPSVNEGLCSLHEQGIVHRDIKPNNLFFSDDQQHVIIGDFGISSLLDERNSVRYTSGSRTLGYAAPETAHGFISKESDYYSFGITLLQLVTGIDPFEGMTDHQILRMTLTEKLQLPTEIHPRLKTLIRGLTIKERSDRWGYEEVKKWCLGETVPIHERVLISENIRPYTFDGRSFTDLTELSLAMADRCEEAIKHLYRGFISEHAKQFGQDLASAIMDCEEIKDHDMGLFEAILFLNPKAPLCWKGEIFFDLSALADSMEKSIPDIREEYQLLLQKGALLAFLRKHDYNDSLIQEIEWLQELAQSEPSLAYFQLYFLLKDTDEFKFQGISLQTVNELVTYLHENRDRIEEYAKTLLDSPYFFSWFERLGHSQHIQEWKKLGGLV